MAEIKIRKVGNSLGVVLPKEMLSRLRVGEGETLYLAEQPGGGYTLTPFDPDFEKKLAAARDIMRRYRNTLHTLAQ